MTDMTPRNRRAHRESAFAAATRQAGLPVAAGMSAVDRRYRAGIELQAGHRCSGSTDLDSHYRPTEAQSHRWDYGVGVGRGEQEVAIWIEPHPASSTREVDTMIEKIRWLRDKLASPGFDQLQRLTRTQQAQGPAFIWLAVSGSIRLKRNRDGKRLAQQGLTFPQRHVRLPKGPS